VALAFLAGACATAEVSGPPSVAAPAIALDAPAFAGAATSQARRRDSTSGAEIVAVQFSAAGRFARIVWVEGAGVIAPGRAANKGIVLAEDSLGPVDPGEAGTAPGPLGPADWQGFEVPAIGAACLAFAAGTATDELFGFACRDGAPFAAADAAALLAAIRLNAPAGTAVRPAGTVKSPP
jgi:hypothetical protein